MKVDPIEEWRRLTELYRQMGDLELRELAVRPEDLTEVAQQVLRDEMRTRRLDERTPGRRPNGFSAKAVATRDEDETSSSAADQEDSGLQTEFTWKTLLCECELREQALQLAAALNQAGVESWVQGGTSQYGLPFSRVLVAADELDHAREVAARPIPQQIIDESKEPIAEFELPVCPACGAEDPVLGAVEPFNTWLCEACGKEWTELAEGLEGR